MWLWKRIKLLLVYCERHLSVVLLMVYEGWPITPLPMADLWAHYLFSFVEMLGRRVCDLKSVQLHAKCTLKHFCDACNEFYPSDLGCGFTPPPQCKKRFLIHFSYFSYPSPPPPVLLFLRVEEQPHVLPFILGAVLLCCFMVVDFELPQHSTLAPGLWD